MAAARFPLALVIPAFKARYLRETLASVAAQTDQRFHLYVCDDASPENLKTLCEASLPADRLTYRRFEVNNGARHIARQWDRCVREVAEPWVWLFSDDDVMEPTCVETFLRAVEADPDGADVYRFNTLMIDGEGAVTRINPPHPPRETGIEFAYHRLTGQRLSFAPEYLFRRAAFERAGSFVDFPFGMGSDDASWITFTGERPIRTLAGPRVHWRFSGVNITSTRSIQRFEKLQGTVEFAAWLRNRFAGRSPLDPGTRAAFDLGHLAQEWCLGYLRYYPERFQRLEWRELPALLETRLGLARGRVRAIMAISDARWLFRQFKGMLGSRLKKP